MRLVLAAAALASGAALVVTALTRVSLALALAGAVTLGGLVTARTLRSASPAMRRSLGGRVRLGLVVGLLATAAYDLSRVLVSGLGGLAIGPFDTLPLFGQALLGPGAAEPLVRIVGAAYHYLNRTAFAVGYCVLCRGRHWLAGVAWALVLEALMVALYPGWLVPETISNEFTIMSLAGHLTYGATLGLLSQWWPARLDPGAGP